MEKDNDNLRSTVTFIIVTYNQERFVASSIKSALNQQSDNLEIIISDDNSSDRTVSIIQTIIDSYRGSHKIMFLKSSVNTGVVGNLNRAVEQATGDIIIVGAGDDIFYKDRTKKIVSTFEKYKCSAIYSAANLINKDGDSIGSWGLEWVGRKKKRMLRENPVYSPIPFYGAGAAYDRTVFEKFGKLPVTVRNEDYNLAIRASLMGGIVYIDDALLDYRKHDENLSYWVKIKNERGWFNKIKLRLDSQKNLIKNMVIATNYIESSYGNDAPCLRGFKEALYRVSFSVVFLSVISGKFQNSFRLIGGVEASLIIKVLAKEVISLPVNITMSFKSKIVNLLKSWF